MAIYLKGFLVACKGIPQTVWVSLVAVIIGAGAGLLLALMRISKNWIVQWIAKIYIDIVRGTPMVVQAFVFAYGIPQLLQAKGIHFT